MKSRFKLYYFSTINLILFLFFSFLSHSYSLFLLPILNILLLLLKHFLKFRTINYHYISFDFVFLYSYLFLTLEDNLIYSLVLFIIWGMLYFLVKEYTIFSNYPFHLYILLLLLIIFNFFKKEIILNQYPEIYLLSFLPLIMFYSQIFFLYVLRIILLGIVLFISFDFNIFLHEFTNLATVFIIIFLFPLQIKRFNLFDLSIKILIIVLEILFIYFFIQKYFYTKEIIIFLYVFMDFTFYFIKNRLLRK
ncbi:MAG: hypothetical protein KatS3mg068_2649 [Candidatus Sericytochromatia bacterium]|nr:MAG: hypothetical protein KatS3mg068_2649 [Candidatus Sericytochromatia bacterium]